MKMLTTRYKTTINHFVLLLSIIIISPPTHYAHGEKKGRILYDFILIRWAWKNFNLEKPTYVDNYNRHSVYKRHAY